jgi:transposase
VPHSTQSLITTISTERLHLALDLGGETWKLAFLDRPGKPRIRTIPARDLGQLQCEIGKAKRRFKLAEDAQVVSCYEAGPDGFSVHRMLETLGVANVVVDPSSIEVERRKRTRKTDRLDASKLVTHLVRYHNGEQRVWSVARVPSEEQEDGRRLHRERERLQKEKKQHMSRIASLLATQGTSAGRPGQTWSRWDGRPLPPDLRAELEREQARLELVREQLREVEQERKRRLAERSSPQMEQVGLLASLRGVGITSAWMLVMEMFGWRPYDNRRTAGSLAGLTGTPFASGGTSREQGINKAGSARIRTLMVELSWLWLRYQPQSQLSQWFHQRWAGSGRLRRIGIVAVARRLFVDLWRLAALGVVPPGADFKPTKA